MKRSALGVLYFAIFATAAVTTGFAFALMMPPSANSIEGFLMRWAKAAYAYGWATGLGAALVFHFFAQRNRISRASKTPGGQV
jgi:cytosine/uracil/thiamine/allantoin permease